MRNKTLNSSLQDQCLFHGKIVNGHLPIQTITKKLYVSVCWRKHQEIWVLFWILELTYYNLHQIITICLGVAVYKMWISTSPPMHSHFHHRTETGVFSWIFVQYIMRVLHFFEFYISFDYSVKLKFTWDLTGCEILSSIIFQI